MSASTRNPMINRMLTENGAWVISDEKAPDQYAIAYSENGAIRALSLDQTLSPEGFYPTAIIVKLDVTGEEQKAAALAFQTLAEIAVTLSDEDTPTEKLLEINNAQALIDLATQTKLANDIANVMIEQMREALRFYADEKHYETDRHDVGMQCEPGQPKVSVDRGAKARAALESK